MRFLLFSFAVFVAYLFVADDRATACHRGQRRQQASYGCQGAQAHAQVQSAGCQGDYGGRFFHRGRYRTRGFVNTPVVPAHPQQVMPKAACVDGQCVPQSFNPMVAWSDENANAVLIQRMGDRK